VTVLQRSELEKSPLADLHAIASELGIEGYRGLRRDDLVGAIVGAQGGDGGSSSDEPEPESAPEPAADSRPSRRSRGRRSKPKQPQPEAEEQPEDPEDETEEGEDGADREPASGTLDILPNGSGFLRAATPGGDDDVYVSPAQIRRCELRAGDEVAGRLRPARRNERHPSLVRVEQVNGHDAEPPEQRPLFDELTAVHASERLSLPDGLSGVPVGKGSRVAVTGGPGAGATRLLRGVAEALGSAGGDLQVAVALVGARPEEVTDWQRAEGVSVTGGSFDRSNEAQVQAAELAVERAKRVAERGGDAVVIIDSLEALPAGAARRLFGAGRKLEEGGSLTVLAASGMAWEPQRQASVRIALDAPAADGTPQVSESRSGAMRADLLG
jgi:transcription termination factor Rho